jgi:hypothetical protein
MSRATCWSASPLRRLAPIAGLLALAGCGPLDGSERELPSGPRADVLYGFNDNSVRAGWLSPERDADLTSGGGGEVSRLGMDWRYLEPEPDRYFWSDYDRIYAALLARGVRPLWIVLYAPPWARDAGVRCASDCRAPPSPAAEGEWAELLALVARRYPRSAGIELWNEPNLTSFWQPRPDAARYARLLKLGYRAIKRARRDMPVVMGGLSNNDVSDDAGNVSLKDFLTDLYEEGAVRYTDALAFHPYPVSKSDPQLVRSVLQVLDVRSSFGDSERPLWVNELGATTSGPDPDLRFSEREQAEALRDAFERLSRVPGVEMVLVHTLIDPPGGGADPEAGYGLLRGDGSPKPAYCALARAARGRCVAPKSG